MQTRVVNVLVMGAGSTGCAAAWNLARGGRSVLLVDRRAADATGPHWTNAIPGYLLDAAGLARPMGKELVLDNPPMRIIAGGASTVVHDHGMIELDMHRFVERLKGLALGAGADLLGQARPLTIEGPARGPLDVLLQCASGRLRVRAALVVDAAGLGASVRPLWPILAHQCPEVPMRDLCAAAQYSFAIADPAAAAEHLARFHLKPGMLLSHLGAYGGYSTEYFSYQEHEVGLLTGTMPADGWPAGPVLMRRLVERLPWLGERHHAATGLIPIRRPYDRLAAGPVVLLGDAGCQVYGSHGSGVGMGLMAARCLGEALATDVDPVDGAWDYAVRWQRGWGWLAAGSTLFARFARSLQEREVEQLLVQGFLTPTLARDGIGQKLTLPPAEELLSLGSGALRNPRLGRRFLAFAQGVAKVQALYRLYPRRPGRQLERWSRAVGRVFRRPPDIS